MDRQRPLLGAFVLAGVSALAIWIAVFFVYALVVDGPVRAAQLVPYLLLGAVLFGAPIVLMLMVLVATPMFLLLRVLRRITLPASLLVGAVCGLVARVTVVMLWGEPESDFVPLIVVAVTGAAAGFVWWRVRTRPDEVRTLRGTV